MTKINKILIYIVIVSALLGCLTYCTKLTAPKPFWDQLGIQAEEIDEIRLTYRGQDVVLDAGDTGRFVQALTLSEPTTVDENHEFTPSDIGVTFTAGGKEYPVTFYWFSYYNTPEGHPAILYQPYCSWYPYYYVNPGAKIGGYSGPSHKAYTKIGNRFDVMIGSQKFHFRFAEDGWTEKKMRLIYDQTASRRGRLSMAQLDDCDRSYTRGGLVTPESYSLDQILDESDLVVLATFEGIRRGAPDYENACCDYERFCVDEVLKGAYEESRLELPTESRGEMLAAFGKVYRAYPAVYAPDYQEGEQYLLCLKIEEGDYENYGMYADDVLSVSTFCPELKAEDHPFCYDYYSNYANRLQKEEDINFYKDHTPQLDFHYEYFGQYTSAVLDGDTLFPRFNTEEHPFYNVKLQEVRERLAK